MKKIVGYSLKLLLLYIIATVVTAVLWLIFQKTLVEVFIEGLVHTLCFVIVIWFIKKINKKQKNDNDG